MRRVVESFKQQKLRYLAIPLVAFVIQFVVGRLLTPIFGLDLRRVGMLASYLLLFAFLVANRRHPGILVWSVGLLMNVVAILANGGFMPVTTEAATRAGLEGRIAGLQSGDVVPATISILLDRSQTHLWFLSDIFSVRSPRKMVFSIGDILVALGVALTLVQLALNAIRPRVAGAKRGLRMERNPRV